MQNGMKIFEREEFGTVRVVEYNGEPWFVASDIARALGYADPSDAVRRHCEKVNKITQQGETPTTANTPPVSFLIIPEEDVYALIFGSELPSAKKFRRWLCDEVLPSIRKTGGYGMAVAKDEPNYAAIPHEIDALGKILGFAGITGNQLALAADAYYRKRTGISVIEASGVQLVAPQQKQLLTPTQIGKELGGISGRKVNLMLAGLGLQRRVGEAWEPTEAGTARGGVLMDTGKQHSNGTPVRQLKWPSDVVAVLQ